MNRRSKQKSCFACVGGKRRCDRTLPTCARCIDRGVQCAYPPPRVRPNAAEVEPDQAANGSLSFLFPFGVQGHAGPEPAAPAQAQDVFPPETLTTASPERAETASNSLSFGTTSSSNPVSSAGTTPLQVSQVENLRWFTAPSTWKLMHHFQPADQEVPPKVFSDFLRGLDSWVSRFQQDGHNPFIHRTLYPPRAIPECIQDAYAAIAVSRSGTANNENITESITHSYASKLLAHQAALAEQPFHISTAKDHLARTQALLIHLLLALSSNSLSRQSKAQALLEPLHRWRTEMIATAEQEASLAQLFPCTATLASENNGWGGEDADYVPDLHRAFVICESIRRTCLLCSMTIGIMRALRGDWTVGCGGDIQFTARAGLWDAESSGGWADVARSTDPLFGYSLSGEELAKRGVQADEVDEFARLLYGLTWGPDKVESWVVRSKSSR